MQKTHINFQKKALKFKRPAKTSRDILLTKDTYYLELWNELNPEILGVGECSPIWGLSPETKEDLELMMDKVKEKPDYYLGNMHLLNEFPSLRFGLEMAQLDWSQGGNKILFKSDFTDEQAPIRINGLVWMGDLDFMKLQVEEKLKQGFDCIKLKIGALDFESEFDLLKSLRSLFSKQEVEIRVDANGAFSNREPMDVLTRLATLDIHSIEQPIKVNNYDEMAALCVNSSLAIALDEELIGITDPTKMKSMLQKIQPQYIILKPSLLGGFKMCDQWISIAEELDIGWWITSALESNIGLNAIAQWTYTKNNKMYQGLGTGQLFENNIISPLIINEGRLIFEKNNYWGEF